MTKFITTDQTKFLTDAADADSIPLYMISREALAGWFETLTPTQIKWAKANHFTAEQGQILKLMADDGALSAVALGLGDDDTTPSPWTYAPLAESLPDGVYRLMDENAPGLAAIGWVLAQYKFDAYQDKKNDRNAVLVVGDKARLGEADRICRGVQLVRDLVNTPTCDMGPAHLAEVTRDLAQTYKAKITETVGDALLTRGFNTIHAVGRAAGQAPRLLDMTWGREDAPKVTLVGKGVCFDTGGLDIKPSSGMRLMKKDMGGAAHVLGLAQMIMDHGLDIRLRLLIPAVENNISGDAFRPGDIITTYKGTTVEVDNTDAEGRLVLCDALALAAEEAPELILDFATLTGAARVALGADVVPFFTDGDELAETLSRHARAADDPVWRLPLYAPYIPQLKSRTADLSNMGSEPFGGAIMAALFLQHFVDDPGKWVHFDVFAWNRNDRPGRPQGGEAMALRTAYSYLKERFSQ